MKLKAEIERLKWQKGLEIHVELPGFEEYLKDTERPRELPNDQDEPSAISE